jgi:hypothetical protein
MFYKVKGTCFTLNLYNRIVANGKSKKLALITVFNKFLGQAFTVVKSGILYKPYLNCVFLRINLLIFSFILC